jgi:two-component system phosphate regulon sensor histidine kinase PhoR
MAHNSAGNRRLRGWPLRWFLPDRDRQSRLQKQYGQLLENLADFCLIIDRNWRCLLANRAVGAFTAKPYHEVVGARLTDTFPDLDQTDLFKVCRQVMEEGHPRQFITTLLLPDGPGGYFEVRVSPIGEGILCLAHDITAERRAEVALREAERLQRMILSSISDFVWSARVKDDQQEMIYFSPVVKQITGYSAEEMLKEENLWERVIHPDDLARFTVAVRKALKGQPVQVEHRIVRRDGEVRWVRNSINPSQSETGLGFRLDGVVADITERKEAEAKLEARASQLEEAVSVRTADLQLEKIRTEAILSSVADGVVILGQNGEILLANPVATRWLETLQPPEDQGRLREALQDIAKQFVHPRKEDISQISLTNLDLEACSAPLIHDGRQTGLVVVLHDVTRLKAMDRLKTEFVSNVSHELRAPLTALKLYINLLRRGLAEKQEHYLSQLENQANKLAALVNNLLDLSRLDRGAIPFAPEMITLTPLLHEIINTFADVASDHGLQLISSLPPDLPPVYADPLQIRQVFTNLLSNAINYTPAGGTVEVKLAYEAEWVRCTISDTGIGIPPAEMPRLFERFFRASNARHHHISGTGLGLAIVKEIVDLHGGSISVESVLGAGTTFHVRLPVSPPPTD